jgi:hypothetical protein
MEASQIPAPAGAVNPSQQAKERERRLGWWCRGDDPYLHWALANRGRYVARRVQAIGCSSPFVWIVDFRRGRKEEIVGTADSLTEAKDLAEWHLNKRAR